MTTVFVFHRDLRLVDHNGLYAAHRLGNPVLPLFIFTPQQVTTNPLKSNVAIQFMLESLEELAHELRAAGGKLHFAYGDTVEVLQSLHRRRPITAVVECRDHTPFAKRRQAAVAKMCERLGAEHVLVDDHYILPPGSVHTGTGRVYQKFTPFYEHVRYKHVAEPRHGVPDIKWARLPVAGTGRGRTRRVQKFRGEVMLEAMVRRLCPRPNPDIAVHGGCKNALALLKDLPTDYAKIRDTPALPTSMLSAHNHFGTVSIREVYAAAKKKGMTEFVRQLYWRDFYGHLMDAFKDLYGVEAYEFEAEGPKQSEKQKKAFRDWCRGTTGYPMVDAGMRQLLKTGWMHNRVRMVVASWLTKDMGVHWRLGERFFAQHLVDYDPAQNMMNWINVASRLPFGMAPFRRLDPDRAAEKHDREGIYVDRWLGEEK